MLLGNNLINIARLGAGHQRAARLFGDAGVAYATVVMTVLIVVFAEVLPKTYAIINADRMALAVAPVVRSVVVGAGAADRRHAVCSCGIPCGLFGVSVERRYRRAGRRMKSSAAPSSCITKRAAW